MITKGYDTKKYDTVILGSGIAGLNLARQLANGGQNVFLASKEAVTEGSSKYAQGGIAVANTQRDPESVKSHIEDTLKTGMGLCDEKIVEQVLRKGWSEVKDLINLGVEFDAENNLEAAHSAKRVFHNGDATGREILRVLLDKVSRSNKVHISQGTEAVSLIKDADTKAIVGVNFVDVTNQEFDVFANNIVLACGGYAALFKDHTCPDILTGDAIALAYDAGAKIENLEFVQFHPTVFVHDNFLISEALRGAGAKLLNQQREAFAHKFNKAAELAPRDVLVKTINIEMKNNENSFVYLDATKVEHVEEKFPNIYKHCKDAGFDLKKDLLPVKPAAHYSIGGVKSNLYGETSLAGLFVIGEAASNGLHGANRLASNSLLECVVMAKFLAELLLAKEYKDTKITKLEYCSDYPVLDDYNSRKEHEHVLDDIRSVVSKNLGIERRQKSIQSAMKYLESVNNCKEKTTAILLCKSALQRKESRGCHYRVDAPKENIQFARSTIISKETQTLRKIDDSRLKVNS
jgi:L-aspartate oxidase